MCLEVLAGASDGAARAHASHKGVGLEAQRRQLAHELHRGALLVGVGVGLVVELRGQKAVGLRQGQFAGAGDAA